MDLINTYVAKGPHNSLIGAATVVVYEVPDINAEDLVPKVSHLYEPRKSLKRYEELLNFKVSINFVGAVDLNNDGEYGIKKTLDKALSYVTAKKRVLRRNAVVNNVKNPKLWHERLIVLAANFYRREYLKSFSTEDMNLFQMDNDLDAQIEFLCGCKYLPMEFLWDKTMTLFQDIYPKPLWYGMEMKTFEEMVSANESN